MAGCWILAFLAAAGLLAILWAALGWILPAGQGCALVCMDEPDEGIRARYRWLRDLGLLNCPLLTVKEEEEDCPAGSDAEIVRPEELIPRLEQERRIINGTGNGDPPGRHRRRGVSEL